MSFADSFVAPGVAPPWLLGPIGRAKLVMLGKTLDQITGPGGKLAQAAQTGMPTRCDATVLPYIGNDRIMPQGAGETQAQYRLRLKNAIPEWQQYSGNAWGVLRELRAQLLPAMPKMIHVSNGGIWDWFLDSDNVNNIPNHINSIQAWIWDGLAPTYLDPSTGGAGPWWRFWIIIDAASNNWTTALGTWGSTGKKWGNTSISWGFNSPSAIFLALQSAITTWKQAGSWCRWMIVTFNAAEFDPSISADGIHNPDGTFGRWSEIVNGQYVAARFSDSRYSNVPE
jgi:hypothetical protein